jgi:hypothetical protein
MKITIKFILPALVFHSAAYSQITEITRLPVQDNSQSITESVPVWLSENEIMVFHVNGKIDTILSTRSNNKGLNWEASQFVSKIDSLPGNQQQIYPAGLMTNSGRILLAWSIQGQGAFLIYSDNKTDWSAPQIILGSGTIQSYQKNLSNLKLSQLDNGSIILSFNAANDETKLFYRISLDDGLSWGDSAKEIPRSDFYHFEDHTIISNEENSLMLIFKLRTGTNSNYRIYSRFSSDNGTTWGDTINISGYSNNDIMPRILKDKNGTLWLAYVRTQIVVFEQSNYKVGDILYKKSSDGGNSWDDEIQLTHFIGDDSYLSMNTSGPAPFFSYSTVKFTGFNQIAYGILDETTEIYTPPNLFYAYSPNNVTFPWVNDPDEFTIRAYIKDDDEVESVKIFFEDSTQIYELFDDGTHNDAEANDGVFANSFPYNLTQPNESFYCNVNKLKVPFSNKGIIAAGQIAYQVQTNFILRDNEENLCEYYRIISININSAGVYDEGIFLFSSGFFLSGYSNGILWSNAVATSTLVEDYFPGTVNSDPDDPLFDYYIINRDDEPFGVKWQRWKDAVALGAEFYDGDNDGIYNPHDKNWNGTWDFNEDMPLLIGDITAWCIYNDGMPAYQRRWQSEPQGIEIRQTVFAANQPDLENVIFIRYVILNSATVSNSLDSVYFGIWEDADIGNFVDDVVGCDTLLNSGFYYNNQPDNIYGENQPSFFTSFLQGPLIQTGISSDTAKNNLGELIGSTIISGAVNCNMSASVFFIGGDSNLSDPATANEARCYLLGKNKVCIYPDPCTFPYCEVRGGVDCNQINPLYWASGDPVTNTGWINTQKRDHKNLISTGPFQLDKDKPQDIIVAYVMGRGTDYFNSITVARENVRRAIEEYESNFASMTHSPPPATDPVTSYLLYQNYPNPFNPTSTIRYELPQDGQVTIEVFDILGQKVRTIVDEFKKADRYEVTFNSTGIASGVYIYIMRVNDFIASKKMVLIR